MWPCAVTVQLRWDPASTRDTSVPLVRNFAKDYVCRPRVGGTETCSGGHKVTTVLGDIYARLSVNKTKQREHCAGIQQYIFACLYIIVTILHIGTIASYK